MVVIWRWWLSGGGGYLRVGGYLRGWLSEGGGYLRGWLSRDGGYLRVGVVWGWLVVWGLSDGVRAKVSNSTIIGGTRLQVARRAEPPGSNPITSEHWWSWWASRPQPRRATGVNPITYEHWWSWWASRPQPRRATRLNPITDALVVLVGESPSAGTSHTSKPHDI
ncbi:hypothetical protein Fcan01_00002 [Folsomia candida]|uniref:Uncharacterized protein n=1 Tax=Folsomia candida TaxID=158441 RepID=A0A226EW51_FOLCA|nr:hypothetical protein Fcan01_00002 [Folsomia candida]